MAQNFLSRVRLVDGTQAAPALSFTGDTNTGIYWSTYSGDAKQLSIATDGATRASFNSAGITSYSNIYTAASGSFRNYSGVWKATTGTTGNGFEFTTADQTGAMTLSSTGSAVFTGSITAASNLTIQGGSSQIILKDTTDDDDHSILFRNNSDGDDYKITTKDFTSAATGDGLYIGSTGGDNVALVTNNVTALNIDTSQNATFAGGVIVNGGAVQVNNAGVDKKISFDRTGGKGISIEHDTSSIYFYNETDAAPIFKMFNGGDVRAYGEVEATSLDINGNADIAGELQVTTNGTATLILRGDNNNSGDTGQLDSTIKMLHDDGTHGILMETKNYAGKQSFEIKSLAAGTESSRFLIHQDNYITTSGNILPQTDNSKDLGNTSFRWKNVYAVNLYGDGSNLTGITATDSTKVAKAGDTMTGNLTLNDNVNLRFGTSGAESTIKSDGADTIMTLSSGAFMIGTNGGTPHDNSGKADFVVDINDNPQISLYSNQVQMGSTDMNWSSKFFQDGSKTGLAAWNTDIQIFTQGSTGATEKTIWIRPQGTDGAITTRAKFMGDSGVYLYGTTTVAGDIIPSADTTYDIGSNANKWAEGHFDHLYVGETGNNPRIDIYTENSTANIADSFADTTTDKSYIYFNAGTSSSDPGYIMHETSDSETNEGVLHLVPSDDNGTGDYVSIHGTNDPDVLKLHTSGLIETVNLQLQIKSGLNDVYINDNLQTTGHITTTADGTYNIGSNGSRFATGYFDAVAVTNTLTAGALDINGNGDVSGNLNITGNITNANWQGDVIAATKGGTGLTSISTLLNSNAFANMQSSSADYDTLTTRGLYRFTGGSNGPAGNSHTTGLTLTENSGNYGWQMASNSSSNNAEGLYYRYRGTSWGPWQTLVTKTFGDGRYLKITDYNPTPNAPTNLTTTIVNETINVTFTASSTSNIDYYLVFSSVAGGDYGLISLIPPDDFGATMSIIDDSFDRPGTQAYRIYAVKNGIYSSALTGSKSYTISTTEPTNMSVIAMNNAYYVQWDPPSTNGRFVANYNVYKHEHATASSLSFSSASLVYSGTRTSYMYAISGTNNNNFHKFWVTITMAS